jgi:CubicO group peptidase (beta-lactamase class C family)
MSESGLSTVRLGRMREVLTRHVERGDLPGVVGLVARRGEVHVEAIGATEAGGGGRSMRRGAIFRIASVTKQLTAAAAMILVEECRVRLDDPVDELLPELADRKVLRRPDGPLDDTVPAHRSITLRDLLTFRLGIGEVLAPPGTYPIQRAIAEAGLSRGPAGPVIDPDEWMKRLGNLPSIRQPGESWMYNTGSDVLGVLMARATGRPLEEFLKERLFEPLRMKDTGFHPRTSSTGFPPPTGPTPRRERSRSSRTPAGPSGGGRLPSRPRLEAGDWSRLPTTCWPSARCC